MKYSFTDWDRREYEREAKKNITISSRPAAGEKITLALSEGDHCFIKLNLSAKEAKAIALTLEAALGEFESTIETQ